MKICIVGAGVAGIQAADALANDHDCHVFEKSSRFGGVWRQNYEGYALQVPAELYEFPGHRHRADDGRFPRGEAVQTYIARVVEQKNLSNRCIFHFVD